MKRASTQRDAARMRSTLVAEDDQLPVDVFLCEIANTLRRRVASRH